MCYRYTVFRQGLAVLAVGGVAQEQMGYDLHGELAVVFQTWKKYHYEFIAKFNEVSVKLFLNIILCE